MIELIDIDGNIKFMSRIICGVNYGGQDYIIYSIKRDEEEDNIFVSRLVKSSNGFAMESKFSEGEKGAIDDVVANLINKDVKDVTIIDKIDLTSINKFSVMNCYVTTVRKSIVRDLINYYGSTYNSNKNDIVVKEKDVSYFSKNNMSVILLIILGILVVVIAIWVIVNYVK